ncbi:MAG: DsbA family protein [Rhodospirillaceae bacterium]|jgi:protein-disulfide isomerase|nr:DsbA family protein [Rhodospirillaceae bacterium]MBT4588063.1 DsbA family protein [Rhodospirillaceae bacterium]MBT4938375.1 DsbA family protein [Rhodospirillaceae bacterium]MBT5938931.1 DsbA family protein [Rhodospirillaceae bacterium]MBT7266661.1 DsbA family protein [Rhodospirillaceae bacterium]
MKNRFYFYLVIALVLSIAGLAGQINSAQAQEKSSPSFTALQKKEMEKIIGDYIRAHPEIILESVRAMQERERANEKQRGLNNLVTYRELILNDPTSPIGGNPKGDVTIVEFFDYNCGYCKRVHPTIEKLIAEDKNIRFVYKEFPILSPQSELAARAALAAWRQDKSVYVPLHRDFINLKGGFSEGRILRLAKKYELDTAQLKKDMNSESMGKIIAGNRALAQQLGITGTPGFIIGNQIVPGAVDLATLKQMVAEARKG